MGCNWRSKVRGFPQGFPQFFDVFNRLWRLIGIVAKYFLAETLDFYAVCDPSLWQVAGSGTNIELHLRTKRGMASFFEGSSEFVNLVPQIYLGVSENSVPLNPMVNDHYPYFLWLFHWEYTQHFQTNPLHTSQFWVSQRHLGFAVSEGHTRLTVDTGECNDISSTCLVRWKSMNIIESSWKLIIDQQTRACRIKFWMLESVYVRLPGSHHQQRASPRKTLGNGW